jgi:hypothetical protein
VGGVVGVTFIVGFIWFSLRTRYMVIRRPLPIGEVQNARDNEIYPKDNEICAEKLVGQNISDPQSAGSAVSERDIETVGS